MSENLSPLLSSHNAQSDNTDSTVLLSDRSGSLKIKNVASVVELRVSHIAYSPFSKTKKEESVIGSYSSISMNDVIGASCLQKNNNYIARIYTYTSKTECCSGLLCGSPKTSTKETERKRCPIDIHFGSSTASADVIDACYNWVNAIRAILTSNLPLNYKEATQRTIAEPPRRRFLVLVNPVSGKGKSGLRAWNEITKPMLEEADINVTLEITKHMNHGRDIVKEMPLKELLAFDAIVVIGGDGLIAEVINGIGSRSEDRAISLLQNKIKLAVIPGGTSNGLVKSVLFECNESYSVLSASFVAVKGQARRIDLSAVSTRDGKLHYAFLILGWGLISDIDIKSETLRCLGELRMTVAGLYFIAKGKKYSGRLRMKLVDEGEGEGGEGRASESDVEVEPVDSSSSVQSQAAAIPVADDCPAVGASEIDWTLTVEGSFNLIWVLQTSHAAYDLFSSPNSKLDDGMFTVFVMQDASRLDMLQLMTAIDSGAHVDHPKVVSYRCSSYSLEPFDATPLHAPTAEGDDGDLDTDAAVTKRAPRIVRGQGLYTLDGEVVEYGEIIATVMPSAATVLSTYSP